MQNTRLEAMREKHAAELKQLEREATIIEALPDDLPCEPTISNIQRNPTPQGLPAARDSVYAWLSFSSPSYTYNADQPYNPVQIFASFERAGWKAEPVTLCKWDNYRCAPYPGTVEEIPQKRPNGYTLKNASAIAPMWVRPEQHTPCEVNCFMRSPDGRLFHVNVDVPGLAYINCKRIEFARGWRFERGTARLSYPQNWQNVNQQSAAYVDTEQGISGAIYFNAAAYTVPATLTSFLTLLLTK